MSFYDPDDFICLHSMIRDCLPALRACFRSHCPLPLGQPRPDLWEYERSLASSTSLLYRGAPGISPDHSTLASLRRADYEQWELSPLFWALLDSRAFALPRGAGSVVRADVQVRPGPARLARRLPRPLARREAESRERQARTAGRDGSTICWSARSDLSICALRG
jgi:hypothetical protein